MADSNSAPRLRYGAACAIILVGLLFSLIRQFVGHADYLVDLRAFYCGGSSVLHHADPYTTIATACGNAIEPGAAILRAPHPPFALVSYALMACFPFKVVGIAYIVLAWFAVGATAVAIAKLTGFDAWLVTLGLAPLLGYYCISLGQPEPFVALCIVLCATSLRSQRYVAAACYAALTLLFPQFGLPMVATLFFCIPRARPPLVASIGTLALIGLIGLGFEANVHYLTVSLRLEQLQTAGDSLQSGLPWLLQQFGFAPSAAAVVGSIVYVATVAAAVVLLSARASDDAIASIALFPPGVVALTSTFVHPQHYALALPVAFFALARSRNYQSPMLIGTALLIVPWAFCIVGAGLKHDLIRVTILCALGFAFSIGMTHSTLWHEQRRSRLTLLTVAGLYAGVVLLTHSLLGFAPDVDTPPNTLATLSFKVAAIFGLGIVLTYGLVMPSAREAQRALR